MADIWKPKYTLENKMAADLMAIERVKTRLAGIKLPYATIAKIKEQVRIRATHYSTRIEGNRLTLEEAGEVICNQKVFNGRQRDVKEVKNYWNALIRIEEWAKEGRSFEEALVQKTHAIVEKGNRAKPTP